MPIQHGLALDSQVVRAEQAQNVDPLQAAQGDREAEGARLHRQPAWVQADGQLVGTHNQGRHNVTDNL